MSANRSLVDRLRKGVYGLHRIPLCEEAAAEIERLMKLTQWQAGEIERLRERVFELEADPNSGDVIPLAEPRCGDLRRSAAIRHQHEIERLRGCLLWLLWHHQGASSPTGQPIRRALGIDKHAPMTKAQIEAGQRFGVGAAAPVAPAVQNGWKLVPVEPTLEMRRYGWDMGAKDCVSARRIYQAMLAVAPQPPAPQRGA